MRRLLIAVAAGALLAGCSATPPRPDVTFYSDGESVRATPFVLFDIETSTQEQDRDAIVRLDMRPGQPVQVSVSNEIAEQPWGVAFSYINRDGQRVDASSKVFLPKDKQHAWTLELPNPDDRLVLAAVQRMAIVNGDRLVQTGYWVLAAQDS
ncbi:hypothetical protein [Alloactinosynnema sp. L-07]|uniref:DUF2771 family protein n=1 Tax=Alloactinosynnema sp. L-07 TaxID=1653480 RepID=UPI00065EF773|nr:DUF2771 family protein [Alloactinosynnema sp. L-07]CRK61309.1 hypothetical protein [Alloactinosynnema sp. L-07]